MGWGVVSALRGGGIPACTEADPPVNRITDACKNITLPQLQDDVESNFEMNIDEPCLIVNPELLIISSLRDAFKEARLINIST